MTTVVRQRDVLGDGCTTKYARSEERVCCVVVVAKVAPVKLCVVRLTKFTFSFNCRVAWISI